MAKKTIGSPLIRNTVIVVGGFFFLRWTTFTVTRLIRIDPFDSFRETKTDLDPQVAIRLDNAELRHYQGAELVTSAKVDRIDVMQDQQTASLVNIRDGMMRREGRTYHFSADNATYIATTSMLSVQKNAHLIGADFDLTASTLLFDGTRERLDINSPIAGTFQKGQLHAASFSYLPKTKYFKATSIEFDGPLDLEGFQDDKPQRTKWNLKGDVAEQSKTDKDVMIYTNGSAQDDEMIISAPHIEFNRRTDVLVATGKIHYFSAKSNVLADKATIFRKEKRALLEGHVQMLIKPKKDADQPPKTEEIPPFTPSVPDSIKAGRPEPPKADIEAAKKQDETIRSGKNIRDYPMVIVCERINYIYAKGKRSADITGSPQAKQELPDGAWRYGWAVKAHYDGEAETMLLQSGEKDKKEVRMKNSIGDDIKAEEVTLSTKEDDDYYKAIKSEGIAAIIDDEDLPRDKKTDKKTDVKKPPPTDLKGKIGGG